MNNNYYDLLEELANKGLDIFKQELTSNPIYKGLLWTEIDETEIQIETWDEENYNSEFLMSVIFDLSGKLIQIV